MIKLKQTWPSDEETSIEYKVHSIRMGDVEDPDLFVAQPIYEWQQTEAGKYVMENSVPTPMWRRSVDMNSYGHQYMIFAYFTPKQLTYYKLKYE
jgi:hypothetical protein